MNRPYRFIALLSSLAASLEEEPETTLDVADPLFLEILAECSHLHLYCLNYSDEKAVDTIINSLRYIMTGSFSDGADTIFTFLLNHIDDISGAFLLILQTLIDIAYFFRDKEYGYGALPHNR
ncbi:hypothetical protein [Dipodfec virus UA06Rod_16]|uniref:Uncharacterized protein n=1 Tax=Dipodfec virus UA06Rod_16 TaxID=2929317 RepID=A0A976R7K3_9VIRU|nr:hypothetical protein [Dipodfec virus UA06Rod_16]